MPRAIIPSFNAGELSPRLWSRVDVEKYGSGCRILENFIIMPYGGVNRRPGMGYLGYAKSNVAADKSRLIGFNFSVTTNFVLEFYALGIRFWSNGVIVQRSGSPVEVVTPYAQEHLFELQYVQINDVMYIVHGSYAPRKLSRVSDTEWTIEEVEWDYPPFRDENLDNGITLTPSATTGTGITVEASSGAYFTAGDVGAFYQIGHRREQAMVTKSLASNGTSASLRVLGDWTLNTKGTWNADLFVQRSKDNGATWETIRSVTSNNDRNAAISGTELEDVKLRLKVTGYSAGSGLAYLEAVQGVVYGVVKITGVTVYSPLAIISGANHSGEVKIVTATTHSLTTGQSVIVDGTTGAGAHLINKEWTVTRINSVTIVLNGSDYSAAASAGINYTTGHVRRNTSTVVADVIVDLEDDTATSIWSEGAWSTRRGFPRTVCLHEQRLLFGGNMAQAATIWGSVTSDFQNFRLGTGDDAALAITIAAAEQNPIQWMVSQKAISIGTSGDEYILSASDDAALTPTNLKVVRQSRYGSAYFPALLVNEVSLFVQRQGRKVREFTYSFERDQWVSPDLTLLAEHITKGGLVQAAFQQQPDSILWAVTGDGNLIGLTYERDQNVVGWHRHTTEGTVESVATIYGDSGDEVWLVVKRGTARHIERLAVDYRETQEEEDASNWRYLDAGVTITNELPVETIRGLGHLEGRTVSVLVDGEVHPDCVVEDGTITLNVQGAIVQVGLPYTSQLQPMALEIPLRDGTSQGRKFRVHRVAIRLYKSRGGQVLCYPGTWDDITHLTTEPLNDSDLAPVTQQYEVTLAGDYRDSADILVRQAQPFPLTVLALIPIFDTYGD